MNVREFILGEEPALQTVFYSVIHTIAASDYTPAQLNTWAPERPDMDSLLEAPVNRALQRPALARRR